MYDYIKGKLTKITAKYIVVEAGGLGNQTPYTFGSPHTAASQPVLPFPFLVFFKTIDKLS